MSHAETVREFYRRQGEERERQRILKLLEKLVLHYPAIDYDDLLKMVHNENRQPV
jgi:hypothetical protein